MSSKNCPEGSNDDVEPQEIDVHVHTGEPKSPFPFQNEHHPVVEGRYTLLTPAVSKAATEVARWLNYRMTGGTFFGVPGVGKSIFISAATRILQKNFRDLIIVTILAKSHGQTNDKAFFSDFLASVNHCYAFTGSAEVMRYRLDEELKRLAATSKTRTVLMFVDEAQKLRELYFHILVDIRNQMVDNRNHLIVALVGQPELVSLRETFQLTKQGQIVNRFMSRMQRFRGICSCSELRDCLALYDSVQYPKNSGITLTSHFFPKAFRKGWRLSRLADDFWNSYLEIAGVSQSDSTFDVPMLYFAKPVEYLLREFRSESVDDPTIEKTTIKEAIILFKFESLWI